MGYRIWDMEDRNDRGIRIRMALLRSKPRRLGWSFEGFPDMVGADEDENRRWDIGYGGRKGRD
jgi:hypothetical protein